MSTQKNDKQFVSAATTFLSGAGLILGSALIYCLATSNTFGMALLGGAIGVLSVTIYFVIKS